MFRRMTADVLQWIQCVDLAHSRIQYALNGPWSGSQVRFNFTQEPSWNTTRAIKTWPWRIFLTVICHPLPPLAGPIMCSQFIPRYWKCMYEDLNIQDAAASLYILQIHHVEFHFLQTNHFCSQIIFCNFVQVSSQPFSPGLIISCSCDKGGSAWAASADKGGSAALADLTTAEGSGPDQ
jgi:hypothetical protein